MAGNPVKDGSAWNRFSRPTTFFGTFYSRGCIVAAADDQPTAKAAVDTVTAAGMLPADVVHWSGEDFVRQYERVRSTKSVLQRIESLICIGDLVNWTSTWTWQGRGIGSSSSTRPARRPSPRLAERWRLSLSIRCGTTGGSL